MAQEFIMNIACPHECAAMTHVDIVDDAGNGKRFRLTATGFSEVWEFDVPRGDDDGPQVALAPSFNGGMVIAQEDEDGAGFTLYSVDIDTGEAQDTIAVFADTVGNAQQLSQEATVTVGWENESDTATTSTPEGIVENWAYFLPPTPGDERLGYFRGSDDRIYVCSVEEQTILRALVDDTAMEEWADLSAIFIDSLGGGDNGIQAMVYDDSRSLIYVIGYSPDEELVIYSFTIEDTPTVTLLATEPAITPDPNTDINAFTFLQDGLWWIHANKVWRYRFDTETIETVLTRTSGSWPTVGGVGRTFIVGAADACNRLCECVPTVEIERVYSDPPADCDPPTQPAGGAGCCEFPGEEHFECYHRYAYDITLCEGRTLKEIVFQGARGRVSIEGVGPVDEIEDWSLVPLTGVFSFNFGHGCGRQEGTLRVTVIDSADCCTRVLLPIACCQCCPVEGEVTVTGDDNVDLNPTYPHCDNTSGIDACGNFAHQICYYKLIFGEGTVTDCSDMPGAPEYVNNRLCYLLEWTGPITERDDNPLPTLAVPGDEIRIKFDEGGEGSNGCLKVTPVDALGGSECFGEPIYFPFNFLYSAPPGYDPETYPECWRPLLQEQLCGVE